MGWLENVSFKNQEIENQRLELTDKNSLYFLRTGLTVRNCTVILKVPARRLHIDCVFRGMVSTDSGHAGRSLQARGPSPVGESWATRHTRALSALLEPPPLTSLEMEHRELTWMVGQASLGGAFMLPEWVSS